MYFDDIVPLASKRIGNLDSIISQRTLFDDTAAPASKIVRSLEMMGSSQTQASPEAFPRHGRAQTEWLEKERQQECFAKLRRISERTGHREEERLQRRSAESAASPATSEEKLTAEPVATVAALEKESKRPTPRARKARNKVTQKKKAKMFGVTEETISNWERRKTPSPAGYSENASESELLEVAARYILKQGRKKDARAKDKARPCGAMSEATELADWQ